MKTNEYKEGYNLNRKIACSLALLTMLLVLSFASNPVNATTYIPGVKAGSTADYKVLGNPALPYNKTHITVWGKTGSYVALTATNYKPSSALDSVVAHNWTIDSYGGASFQDAVFYWVVGANFTKGDNVLPDTAFGVNVQNNLTMTVAGVSRFVQHANGSGLWVTYFDMYFDRATGLVIQGNYATASGWINVTLISTNVWSPPAPAESPFSTISIIAIAGVGIVALVVGLLIGRHGKRKR
jgi:hypothetical protein